MVMKGTRIRKGTVIRNTKMLLRRLALKTPMRKGQISQVSLFFTTGVLRRSRRTGVTRTSVMNRNSFAIQARVAILDWSSGSRVVLFDQIIPIPANQFRTVIDVPPTALTHYEVVVILLSTTVGRTVFNHFGFDLGGSVVGEQTVLRGLFRQLT